MQKILGALMAAVLATGAAAHPECRHAPLITTLAETIFDGRRALPTRKQARFGDTAAYMAIRYGGADGEVLQDLANGDTRAPRLLDDLRGAYDLARRGDLPRWQAGTPDVLDQFIDLLPSTRRALLLADNGVTYFDLLDLVTADPDLAQRLGQSDPFGTQAAFALTGAPVSARQTIAKLAEGRGHLWVAAAILGDLPDRAAFDAFVARHAGADAFADLDVAMMLGFSTTGVMAHDVPLRGPRAGDAAGTVRDAELHLAMKAGMAGMPSDFLNIYLNQSGQARDAAFAAAQLLDAIGAGTIDPQANPEAAWLLMYRSVLARGTAANVQQTLATFNWPSQSVRHYAGFAIESLDVMVAAQMDGDAGLTFARDVMVRLDALCDGYLSLPGGAIRFGAQAVYRFE